MIKLGFHINQQKIWAGSDNIYTYFDYIYWVQKRLTILGIPILVNNIKGFGNASSALKYIHELTND